MYKWEKKKIAGVGERERESNSDGTILMTFVIVQVRSCLAIVSGWSKPEK